VNRKTDDIADRASGIKGLVGAMKDRLADSLGATRARVDLFQADVEHRLFRLLAMLIWGAIAFTCLSLGLVFAVLTIIFGFHLPPKYVFGIPALLFIVVGVVGAIMFRVKKASKPDRDKRGKRAS
jgi:uncharacterized membrane protein YqjE